MDRTLNAKTMKKFVFHVNVHLRVTSIEYFNQVDRMPWSMDNSQPFTPAIPWTNEQRHHGGRDGGYAWAQQHGLHSPRLIC